MQWCFYCFIIAILLTTNSEMEYLQFLDFYHAGRYFQKLVALEDISLASNNNARSKFMHKSSVFCHFACFLYFFALWKGDLYNEVVLSIFAKYIIDNRSYHSDNITVLFTMKSNINNLYMDTNINCLNVHALCTHTYIFFFFLSENTDTIMQQMDINRKRKLYCLYRHIHKSFVSCRF